MIEKMARSFLEFTRLESTSGILLLVALGAAVGWANSPWSDAYFHLLEAEIGGRVAGVAFTTTLHHAVNDGLMTIFFFVVGMEIKREMVAGELASLGRAAVPVVAAIGGMVVPALIYTAFNAGQPTIKGWGVPMATDIPFALGILALLGNRVPGPLKVYLMALAIIDDLGSVLVIAIFYSGDLDARGLGLASAVLAALIALNRLGAQRPILYLVPGALMWYLLQKSGIHGTIAGVLVAWTIPATSRIRESDFASVGREILSRFESARHKEETPFLNNTRLESVMELEAACEKVQPPLQRLEESLHAWTSYAILPLFALANAGFAIQPAVIGMLAEPVGLGILFGLVVGKPLGIFAATRAMMAAGFPALSGGVTWKHLLGAGILGGIGFTMSIFVANLAFGEGALLDGAKLSIFLASAIAGGAGWLLLRLQPPPPTASAEPNREP